MDRRKRIKAHVLYREQLGMDVGQAYQKLHKMLLLKLAKMSRLDICFRCGGRIKNVEDFTIDHKKVWRHEPNAKKLFWDLKNIAFSHLPCNRKKRGRQRIVFSKSGYKGVYPAPKHMQNTKPWTARVQGANHYVHVGYFKEKKQAALAYDKALILVDGRNALTNAKLGLL